MILKRQKGLTAAATRGVIREKGASICLAYFTKVGIGFWDSDIKLRCIIYRPSRYPYFGGATIQI